MKSMDMLLNFRKLLVIFVFYTCTHVVLCSRTFFYQSSQALLQITFTSNEGFICDVVSDRLRIKNILKTENQTEINHIDRAQMHNLLKLCSEEKMTHDNRRKRWTSIFSGIYPGTKWCGISNSARNYTDLGYFRSTDTCCRNHDNCPEYKMPSGLLSWSSYPTYSCRCEEKFHSCLKNSTDELSVYVGNWYFNVFQSQCFLIEMETVCLEASWWWGSCRRTGQRERLVYVENSRF